jgi:SAM-dependent methyltransferase
MGNSKSKSVPPAILEEAREFFSQYPPTASLCIDDHHAEDASGSSNLSEHIMKYQKAAYKIHSYPCIAMFRFLRSPITKLPNYHTHILPRLKAPSSALFLDVGCCFGQVIRRLVVDGADPNNLIGTDLHQEFIDLGYGLFRDGPNSKSESELEHHLTSTFVAGDIFDERVLAQFKGRIEIIHATSMLHLFSWEKQIKVCNQFDQLLIPQGQIDTNTGTNNGTAVGAMIVGSQLGVAEAGPMLGIFRHNAETFKKMWTKVGDGRWLVEVVEEKLDLDMNKISVKLAVPGEVLVSLRFIVTRI